MEPQKKSRGLTTALASAFLEWLLIFMLLLDAIFTFIIRKCAGHWRLLPPCLLCSRPDHYLDSEKKRFNWDLICLSHKAEISSLFLCRAHNKLVDVRGLCESCRSSHKLLADKLGEDRPSGSDEDSLPQDERSALSSQKHCTCCNEAWCPRRYVQKLDLIKSVGANACEDVSTSSVVGLDNEDSTMEDLSTSDRVAFTDGFYPLSYRRETELKSTEDGESEIPFYDGNNAGAQAFESSNSKEYLRVQHVQMEPCITSAYDNAASEELCDHPASEPKPSSSVSHLHPIKTHPDCSASAVPTIPTRPGLEEHDQQPEESKHEPTFQTELISPDHVPPSSNAVLETVGVEDIIHITRSAEGESEHDEIYKGGVTTVTMSEVSVVDPSSETRETDEAGGMLMRKSETEVKSGLINAVLRAKDGADCGETYEGGVQPMMTSDRSLEDTPVLSDSMPVASHLLDLSEAYKLAVGTRGRQLSSVIAERWTNMDSSRVSEDLKLLLSQVSARGIEQSTYDASPRFFDDNGETKKSDTSSDQKLLLSQLSGRGSERSMSGLSPRPLTNSDEIAQDYSDAVGLQLLQKRISLDRNESGLSLDGSIVSEIEGECLLDRLKRQVEHDRKIMSSLYKELEEERSASAIAANQAMAMITRLQEEKATLHMEALQCLRMMEEQTEYDNEALQNSNDLLAAKEKEIQNLKTEVEYCRKKYLNGSMLENLVDTSSGCRERDLERIHTESRRITSRASASF